MNKSYDEQSDKAPSEPAEKGEALTPTPPAPGRRRPSRRSRAVDIPDAGPFPYTVMQVLPALVTGGVERGTIDMAIAVQQAGGRAIVVSSGGPLERELARAGALHITLPVDSKNFFVMRRNARRLLEIARQEGVDLIHARSRAPAWSARSAARRAGLPFVTTFHGTYNFRSPIKKAYNAVMAKGDRVIAISDFIADHIRTVYKADPARVVTIHRGIDLAIFDPAAVPPARIVQLAEDWRLPDGLPVIMLPGRLTRWKGQAVFLDALAKLQRDDFVAVLVGSDQGRTSYRSELEGRVRRLGLESVTRFVDHCNDMPAAFMLADIVVSASTDPEAFGRVVVEAQAMGRPVIASDHGGARETIIPGETGWLVIPDDPDELAKAIEKALNLSKTARARLARAAIRNAQENFSRELMCARTLLAYKELLEAGPRKKP